MLVGTHVGRPAGEATSMATVIPIYRAKSIDLARSLGTGTSRSGFGRGGAGRAPAGRRGVRLTRRGRVVAVTLLMALACGLAALSGAAAGMWP